MKYLVLVKLKSIALSSLILLVLIYATGVLLPGCKDDNANPSASYQQVNLVASVNGFGAAKIDTNLVNAWGIAIGPTGSLWISSNHKDRTTIYDRTGATLLPAVDVEEPTGVVYNNTTDFVIPSTGLASKFIYAGEGGKVFSWNSGTSTIEVADHSAEGAVYKGVALAQDGGANFLYIADFSQGKVTVLDKDFNPVTTKLFADPSIPAGFDPFNIQNIDGKLYVSYAKLDTTNDDIKGPGNGFVNIFNTDGTLVKRFASQGTLNSPWGMTKVPDGFNQGSGAILIGNFGDGRINIFSQDGEYKGQLKDGDTPIAIDGLWAIAFPSNGVPAGDQNVLFFAAGPSGEDQGLFGTLKLR